MYMNAAPAAGYSPAKQKADEPIEVTYDGVPDDVNMDLGAVDAHVRSGFVQKVFSLVAAQLLLTAAVCAAFMFVPSLRGFVLAAPSMQMLSFFASLGLLMACFAFKDQHPNNLYCLFAFTLSIAWSVGTVCARYYAVGLGLVVLQAVALTASATVGLTLYTLRSKKDFSYMGAALGASLWVLIIGSLVCSLVGMPGMHLALSVGGAAIFSLYIVYDVHMIAKRLSPDEYVLGAITLYLDIINLFLHLLRSLSELQRNN